MTLLIKIPRSRLINGWVKMATTAFCDWVKIVMAASLCTFGFDTFMLDNRLPKCHSNFKKSVDIWPINDIYWYSKDDHGGHLVFDQHFRLSNFTWTSLCLNVIHVSVIKINHNRLSFDVSLFSKNFGGGHLVSAWHFRFWLFVTDNKMSNCEDNFIEIG